MEENILRDFETFEEFPCKYLKINNKSNVVRIKKDNDFFVAREKIESVINTEIDGIDVIKYTKSYLNIKDNKEIIKVSSIYSLINDEMILIALSDNIEIINLSNLLNIHDNDVIYYDKDDIDTLLNFEKESSKTYKKV